MNISVYDTETKDTGYQPHNGLSIHVTLKKKPILERYRRGCQDKNYEACGLSQASEG